MKNIYLIGFMGSGKSSAAGYLHRTQNMPLYEMDEMIVRKENMAIPEIFASKGEAYFRDLETEVLKEAAAEDSAVVSCGGGVVLRDLNVEIMKKSGKIILLEASPETILNRVASNHNRPLLEGKKNVKDIQKMMDERRTAYETAADIHIKTDGKSVKQICREIVKLSGE